MSEGTVFVSKRAATTHAERRSVVVVERSVPPVVIAPSQRPGPVVVLSRPSTLVAERPRTQVVFAGRERASMVIAAGKQGPRGVPGPPGAGEGGISLPFAFGDATPSEIGEYEGVFIATSIVITEPFNGAGAALSVGTMSDPELLMPADGNQPDVAGRHEANPSLRIPLTSLYLFITPGIGATQGRGIIYLESVE